MWATGGNGGHLAGKICGLRTLRLIMFILQIPCWRVNISNKKAECPCNILPTICACVQCRKVFCRATWNKFLCIFCWAPCSAKAPNWNWRPSRKSVGWEYCLRLETSDYCWVPLGFAFKTIERSTRITGAEVSSEMSSCRYQMRIVLPEILDFRITAVCQGLTADNFLFK